MFTRIGQGSFLTIQTHTLPQSFILTPAGKCNSGLTKAKCPHLAVTSAVPHAPCPLGMGQLLPVFPTLQEICLSLYDALPCERQTGGVPS